MSASTLCIPWQPHSSKAWPRFSGDVYTYVVGAKNWQLLGSMGAVPPPYPRTPAVPREQAGIGHQEVRTAGGSTAGARCAGASRRAAGVVCVGASPWPGLPSRLGLGARELVGTGALPVVTMAGCCAL